MSNLLNRSQCVDVITRNASVGITTIVVGQAGWGKTAITDDLQKRFPKHRLVVCNMAPKEAGDMVMPRFVTVDGKDVVRGVAHEDLGLHHDEDVILFIDEFFKTKRANQVALAELLYNKRFGNIQLSEKSFICGASNSTEEGYGDASIGFVEDRIQTIEMRKPTAEEWIEEFAIHGNIHPIIITAARQFPMMFQDYRDISEKTKARNPYIWDPILPKKGFVTGRALEFASKQLYALSGMDNNVIEHVLESKLGPAAAGDIMGLLALSTKLPEWTAIISDPMKTKVPKESGLLCMIVYRALQNVNEENFDNFFKYLTRLDKEYQALFFLLAKGRPAITHIMLSRPEISKWSEENVELWGRKKGGSK